MAARAPTDPDPVINSNPQLQSYYSSVESVLGYDLVLGGVRHFGYYEKGTYNPFPISGSLIRMEDQLREALDLPKGSQVLDSGCGNGIVALRMASHGLRVLAIDVVDRHLERAQRASSGAKFQDGSVQVRKMDFHHLETLPDASLDGVYTMETFVHATDPQTVLDGYFRILRPGGHIAMHEYDHVFQKNSTGHLARSMTQVNELSAMPTNMKSNPGVMKEMLETAGFVDVKVKDLSDDIRPMTRLFFALAIIPFIFVSLLGLERYFINTVAGVQSYRGYGQWRYIQLSARKPEQAGTGKTPDKG